MKVEHHCADAVFLQFLVVMVTGYLVTGVVVCGS